MNAKPGRTRPLASSSGEPCTRPTGKGVHLTALLLTAASHLACPRSEDDVLADAAAPRQSLKSLRVPSAAPGGFDVRDDVPRERMELTLRWLELSALRLQKPLAQIQAHLLLNPSDDSTQASTRAKALEVHASLIAAARRAAALSLEIVPESQTLATLQVAVADAAEAVSEAMLRTTSPSASTQGSTDTVAGTADAGAQDLFSASEQLQEELVRRKDSFDYAYEALQAALDRGHEEHDGPMLALVGGRDGLGAQAQLGVLFSARRVVRCIQTLEGKASLQPCSEEAADFENFRSTLRSETGTMRNSFWLGAFVQQVESFSNAVAPLRRTTPRRLTNRERLLLEETYGLLLAEANQLLSPHVPRRAG